MATSNDEYLVIKTLEALGDVVITLERVQNKLYNASKVADLYAKEGLEDSKEFARYMTRHSLSLEKTIKECLEIIDTGVKKA